MEDNNVTNYIDSETFLPRVTLSLPLVYYQPKRTAYYIAGK